MDSFICLYSSTCTLKEEQEKTVTRGTWRLEQSNYDFLLLCCNSPGLQPAHSCGLAATVQAVRALPSGSGGGPTECRQNIGRSSTKHIFTLIFFVFVMFHLSVLQLCVDVVVCLPQLLVLLPQVINIICNGKQKKKSPKPC